VIAALVRAPSAVRYIKLGQNGRWAARALGEGILPFGFEQVGHAPCSEGNWDTVRKELLDAGRSPAGATQGVRELKDFYENDAKCLWVTFADGHLWWTFAEADVIPLDDDDDGGPRRYRRTCDGWHRHSLAGDALTTRSLSSALTRVAGYRMTVCGVEREAYLLRRIQGVREPLQAEAEAAKAAVQKVAANMIAQLDWRDFEIMVDLIFARGGWQRSSAVGDGEVDVDLMLTSPTTGETAWVQIKSSATQTVLDDYIERFRRDGSCDRFFFVCHSPKGTLTLPPGSGMHLWVSGALADSALRAGLLDWLVERVR
jgi:hypothetical protein